MKWNKREIQALKIMQGFVPEHEWGRVHVSQWLKIRGCGPAMIHKLLDRGMATKCKKRGRVKIPTERPVGLKELLEAYDV